MKINREITVGLIGQRTLHRGSRIGAALKFLDLEEVVKSEELISSKRNGLSKLKKLNSGQERF